MKIFERLSAKDSAGLIVETWFYSKLNFFDRNIK